MERERRQTQADGRMVEEAKRAGRQQTKMIATTLPFGRERCAGPPLVLLRT
jgi:hypothetical protein